ncbi:potassium channel protein [Planctomycetes bacterium K23_9]|uniref:Potassium channel protein n=1 Tax=Stieleria marina TaxID=1930275 RepID=A0A517NYD5_9BACT|nr:hypothetical protein K239x_41460 [Planctomycetes bacterium K23_9]
MNADRKRSDDIFQWVAGRSAKPMFYVSLTYLISLACLVVLWVDMPSLQEKVTAAVARNELSGPGSISRFAMLESIILWVMAGGWIIVTAESIMHWLSRPWDAEHRKYHFFAVAFCICPALRMCARSPEMGHRLWLPGLGWRRADKRLRRRLERQFSVPMIIIALMIMPILIVEFFMKAQVANHTWLRACLHIGTGIIWFAFAIEFILMVSVADRKLAYCKKHWIDLAIILLPLFSFLRSLRALRATRLAKLMRIPQVGKVARVYRLRGTAIKAAEALILLGAFHRWTRRDPEKAIANLQRKLVDVESEAKRLRRQIAKLKKMEPKPSVPKQIADPNGT